MTPEHQKFIEQLSETAPFTAAALKGHWEKGERYYIDSRVDIRGHRREFNRLNNMILHDQIKAAPTVEEREGLVVDNLEKMGLTDKGEHKA